MHKYISRYCLYICFHLDLTFGAKWQVLLTPNFFFLTKRKRSVKKSKDVNSVCVVGLTPPPWHRHNLINRPQTAYKECETKVTLPSSKIVQILFTPPPPTHTLLPLSFKAYICVHLINCSINLFKSISN